jgi:hypothetical protein
MLRSQERITSQINLANAPSRSEFLKINFNIILPLRIRFRVIFKKTFIGLLDVVP